MTTAFTLRAALSESFYKNVLQQVANRMTERHLMKYLDWNGIKLGMFLLLWASGPFSAFSQRKRPFPLKWVTPSSVMWGSTKTYICVDVLSGALGKMTTCFSFFTRSDGFSPRFCWDTGGGITSVSVAICCPSSDVWPCFFIFFISFVHFHHRFSLGFTGRAERRSWTSPLTGRGRLFTPALIVSPPTSDCRPVGQTAASFIPQAAKTGV